MSPTALTIAKRSFNADTENIRGISFLGIQTVKHYYQTEESKEGVRAFNETRKPDFKKYAWLKTWPIGARSRLRTTADPHRARRRRRARRDHRHAGPDDERVLGRPDGRARRADGPRRERPGGAQLSCVTSGKPSFLAGADLVMVRGFTDERAKRARTPRCSSCAAGSGASSCAWRRRRSRGSRPSTASRSAAGSSSRWPAALRLVADDPRIQLGVPEVRWGLLPGAGGTQRLPRLAGFEPAMDLLLSGRSIDAGRRPCGSALFARAVPAAACSTRRKAAARALHGQPVRRCGQVRAPGADRRAARTTRRSRARSRAKHGVDADDFRALSRVQRDRRQRAARRTPAAGRSDGGRDEPVPAADVQPGGRTHGATLFLERLRAERELRRAAGTGIERLALSARSRRHVDAWAEALNKAEAAAGVDAALPADTLEIVDQRGERHRVALRVLDETCRRSGRRRRWRCSRPPGRTAACSRSSAPMTRRCGAGGARRRISSRCRGARRGRAACCSGCTGAAERAGAHRAAVRGAQPALDDPAFIDVAACLAGVTPAWTGGPLTWLWEDRTKSAGHDDRPQPHRLPHRADRPSQSMAGASGCSARPSAKPTRCTSIRPLLRRGSSRPARCRQPS